MEVGEDVSGRIDCTIRDEDGRESRRSYVLIKKLGEGGQGDVYAATDETTGEVVAVKYLKKHATGNEVAVQRFEREAKIAMRIRNPHLLRVMALFTDQHSQIGFVMQYVRGGIVLSDLIEERRKAERPFSLLEIADMFSQMLTAVEALHQGGVIHRDLKPENFLLTVLDGRQHVILSDFGIARATNESAIEEFGPTITQLGSIVGTPYFIAPEQQRPRKQRAPDGTVIKTWKACEQTDIWALGIILYHLVTGRYPFTLEGSIDKTIGALWTVIEEDDPPPYGAFLSNPDPKLEAFNRRLLVKMPWNRLASIAQVRSQFDTVLSAAIQRTPSIRPMPAQGDPPDFLKSQTTFSSPPPPHPKWRIGWSRLAAASAIVMSIVVTVILVLIGIRLFKRNRGSEATATSVATTASSTTQESASPPASQPTPSATAGTPVPSKRLPRRPPPGSPAEHDYATKVAGKSCKSVLVYGGVVLNIYPDYPEPHLAIAECMRRTNDTKGACHHYGQYLSFDGVPPPAADAQKFIAASCGKP